MTAFGPVMHGPVTSPANRRMKMEYKPTQEKLDAMAKYLEESKKRVYAMTVEERFRATGAVIARVKAAQNQYCHED